MGRCAALQGETDTVFDGFNAPIVLAVAGSGVAGALIDMRTRRLPNPLTMGIAATGLALAVADWSGLTIASAVGGFALGAALMLPGFLIGATGGGDVKFFAATGTLLGPELTLLAFVYTLIAGGVLAVSVAIYRRCLRETLTRAAVLIGSGGANAAEIEHPSTNNRFAYAPAIALGTLVAALGL